MTYFLLHLALKHQNMPTKKVYNLLMNVNLSQKFSKVLEVFNTLASFLRTLILTLALTLTGAIPI